MNLICIITFTLAIAAAPLALLAQPAAGQPPLPLAQVLALTAAHYPSIKGRQAELDAARYAVKERRDDYLPKTVFQAQVQGTFYPNEGSAIPVVGSVKPDTNISDMVWTSGSTLYTDWSFFNFGRVKAGCR